MIATPEALSQAARLPPRPGLRPSLDDAQNDNQKSLAEFSDLPTRALATLELFSARTFVGCATVRTRFWFRVAAGEQEFSELLTKVVDLSHLEARHVESFQVAVTYLGCFEDADSQCCLRPSRLRSIPVGMRIPHAGTFPSAPTRLRVGEYARTAHYSRKSSSDGRRSMLRIECVR